MTPAEAEELLLANLLDLPEAEREAYLQSECRADPVLYMRLVLELERRVRSFTKAGPAKRPAQARLSGEVVAQTLAHGLEIHDQPGSFIGRYQLIQKIGEGGCGVVFLAEQQEPVQRKVALKLIKLGLDTREFVARFATERQALAMMDHPNIAHVYDAGATETGRPFFVMELVRGVPITRYCEEHQLSVAERLRLLISVCQAVQHAHQKGIIHRDLKPSNILVTINDNGPVPKIIDFGIAKAMDVRLTDQSFVTQFHSFVGTPAYTSPEQMEMTELDVDTRADIYSLGVLLYELLTGRPPFDSDALQKSGLEAMRRTVREVDPHRPSQFLNTLSNEDRSTVARQRGTDPSKLSLLLRGDLDWIVMRCLEKNRTRRYETANGLAVDLQRHLSNEPVVARPPNATYRFQKLVRRNKLTVTAGIAVAAVLILGTITSTWQAVRATRAERDARSARAHAEAEELVARRRAYASDMNVAWQALHENNLGRAQDLLDRQRPQPGQSDLRGWEWRYLWGQTRNDALSVLCETSEIESLAVSADGRWLAIGLVHKDGLFVWDLLTRKQVAQLGQGKGWLRTRAAFSPTEPLLAFTTTDDVTHLNFWNAATNRLSARIPLAGECQGLFFSQDGQTLAVSSADSPRGHITFWRVSDAAQVAEYPSDQISYPPGTPFAVTRDLSVAAYGAESRIRVVDLHTGKERWSALVNPHRLTALAFSPDGKTLATASGVERSEIGLWEVSTGKETGRLLGHTSWVGSLVFWPDGRKLASASADQTIRLWDVSSLKCTDLLRGHRLEVWRLLLLPDNRTLVSGCKDGQVFLWDTSVAHPREEYFKCPETIAAWCFSPDSRSALTVNGEGQVARWSGSAWQVKETVMETGSGSVDILSDLFSPDGRFLAEASDQGIVSVWDVTRRLLLGEFKPGGPSVMPICFRAEGSCLVIWSRNESRLVEWDLVANRQVQSWPAPRDIFQFNWGLSPTERELIVTGLSGEVSVRDLVNQTTTKPKLNALEVGGVSFSPSGRLVATTSWLGYVRIWEKDSWREVATLRGYINGVISAAFSPDEKRLATSSGSKQEALKLWAVDGWQDLLTLTADDSHFIEAAFSPDGNTVGVMTVFGGLYLWRALSEEEIKQAEAKRP